MTDDRIADIRRRASQRYTYDPDEEFLISEIDRLRAEVATAERAVEAMRDGYVGDMEVLRATIARVEAAADKWAKAGTVMPIADVYEALRSAGVVGGEATPTETPQPKTEPIVRVLRAGEFWYWVCSECDDRFSTLTSEDAARQGAASHEEAFHSPAAVPVPAETPETVVGDFPCCASRTTGETTE